jgi:hypothetical protein
MADDNYGEIANLSVWDKIRLIQEWSPLLTYGQSFLAEHDPHKKSLIVADLCEWLAGKSNNKVDDELVDHITAVLKSPQGEALVRWVVTKIQEGSK